MGLPENFLPAEEDYITLDVQLKTAQNAKTKREAVRNTPKLPKTPLIAEIHQPPSVNFLHTKTESKDKLTAFLMNTEVH